MSLVYQSGLRPSWRPRGRGRGMMIRMKRFFKLNCAWNSDSLIMNTYNKNVGAHVCGMYSWTQWVEISVKNKYFINLEQIPPTYFNIISDNLFVVLHFVVLLFFMYVCM